MKLIIIKRTYPKEKYKNSPSTMCLTYRIAHAEMNAHISVNVRYWTLVRYIFANFNLNGK